MYKIFKISVFLFQKMRVCCGSDCNWLRWISSLLLVLVILVTLETDQCEGRPRLRDNFGLPDDSMLNRNRKTKFYINNVPDIACPEGKRMGLDGICRDQILNRQTFSKHRHQHGNNSIRENWWPLTSCQNSRKKAKRNETLDNLWIVLTIRLNTDPFPSPWISHNYWTN